MHEIIWPGRDRTMARIGTREHVQFRLAAADRARLLNVLARLQVIAPEAALKLTDVLVAATISYLDGIEAKLESSAEAEIRVQVQRAPKARRIRRRNFKESLANRA